MNNWSELPWFLHIFFILTNFKYFMKFNHFSMILKQTQISMIFQEMWQPCIILAYCDPDLCRHIASLGHKSYQIIVNEK